MYRWTASPSQRDPQDERQQRRQHEAVERRTPDGRQVEPAQHDAEQANDQQRLVRGGRREHRDRCQPPQRTRGAGTDRPVVAPSRARAGTGARTPPGQRQPPSAKLVQQDERDPAAEQRGRHDAPHRDAEQRRAEQHRRGRARPARVDRRDLVDARPGDQRGRDARERRHSRSGIGVSDARTPGPTRRGVRARRSPARACAR